MMFFLYIIFFIMGTLLGSFCTLAVYRIPLKKDITHERSFCPKCGHKLGFFDLIPVISYLGLKGKCRYCGEKIRIRYLLLEVLSGIVIALFFMSFHFSMETIELSKYVAFFFGIIYMVVLILIAGINKESYTINASVLVFGILVMMMYILYLSIVEKANIDRYAIYFFFVFILLAIDFWNLKKKKISKITPILILLLLFLFYTGTKAVIATVIITLLIIAMQEVKNRKKQEKRLPIGFYLCMSNIVVLIFQNFLYFY